MPRYGRSVKPVVMSRSRMVPVEQAFAFDAVLPMPLTTIFSRWFGPLPAISRVDDQEGPWRTKGQSRTIRTADGGVQREELVEVSRPHVFGYRLTPVRGPLLLLIATVDGTWAFRATGDGTDITWQWIVHPRSRAAGLMLPVVGRLWQGYAKRGLERVAVELQR